MSRRRRNAGLEMGVLLLASEMMRFGISNIPPVTLISIVGQTLLYLGIINVPWEREDVCISANAILKGRDWRRLFLSAVEHGDDMHLYYNMASFLIKGRSLERKYGSKNFGLLLTVLLFLTSFIYVFLGYFMTAFTNDKSYAMSCAIGFSGVIFALKVVTTYEQPNERTYVGGFRMPGKYAAWAELFLIHFLVPNASFLGHLAGILAGVLYTSTYFGSILDKTITSVTGDHFIHRYEYTHPSFREASSDTSYQEDYYQDQSRRDSNYGEFGSRSYGWNTGYNSFRSNNFRRPSGFNSFGSNGYGWNFGRQRGFDNFT